MKKSFYLALLFVGISLSSLVTAGTDAISTAGRSDLAFASNSSGFPVSPSVEGINGGPAIVTLPVSGSLCSGSTVVVDFTCSALFGISNTFNVELSDASGSFASPVTISVAPLSSVGFVTGGQIFAQIPNGTPFGTAYRIRVVSTDPVSIGLDNGADLVIKTDIAPPVPTVSVNGPTDFCFGSATTFLTSSVAQNNLWFPGGVNTNPFIGVVSEGCYYTQVSGSNGCATSSFPVCINVNTPIFTFLGYFENGSLVTTTDTTVTICQGDSAQLGLIIEGGIAPFDIFYTPNGLDVVTVNDVGVPYNAESYVYTFYASQAGFYQTVGITDNFPTNCGSNGNAGLVSIQIAPPPVTTFSYAPFCGPVSQTPTGAPGFLTGGSYTFDVVPVDGATVDASTGVISNATIGNTYIIRYTVEGPFCEGSSTVSVTVDATDITAFTIAPFCSNNASEAPVGATGFAVGGTYSFQTSPLDGAQIDAATGIITNASANATYTVVYASPAGVCQNNSSTSVTTIESPELTGTVVNTLCGQANGSIDITVTAGLTPYTYSWSNSLTTEDISSLTANSYTVTATDANGCTVDSSFTIINTNAPELELVVSNAVCGSINGSIDLTVTGGTGPFDFLWTPGDASTEDISGISAGAYSVQVTDITTTCVVSGSASVINQDAPTVTFTSVNALCGVASGSIDVTVTLNGGSSAITHSWSNGATTEDISDLNAGTYIDTVRDGNSCEVIISVTITNSNQFTATSTVVNPTCVSPTSGSIDVTIVGGTEPFTFVWSPNSTATTEDVSGLAPGAYTVEISDAASCSTSVSSTIAPLNTISLSSTQINATCGNTDGSINLEVSGGSGSYSFLWSNGETTEDIAGLDTGSYTVTVSDLSDVTCTESQSLIIIYGNLPQLSFVTGPVSCTSPDGTVDLTVTGGSSNYSFSWTGPDAFSETTEDLSGLASGVYNVSVTDLTTTCVVSGSADVESVNSPVLAAVVANTTCGQDNGIIDITVTGGTEPFTIDWSNLASGQDQINLAAGSYTITLTDDNGCVATEEYTINGSVQPTSDLVILQPACDADTGSVEVTLTNATNPVIYSWKKDGAAFASFANISDLAPGTYVLTATDGSGCVVLDTAVLAYPNIPTLATVITNTLCGLETGAVDLTVTGGSGNYTFLWDDSFGFTATTEDINDLAFGCYAVTVTDENGCEVTTQACIENDNAPTVVFEVTNPSCNLDNGSITAIITGGIPPYSISWTGTTSGDTTITDLSAGVYYLVVIDDNGCESIDSVSLSNTGVPSITANSINPSCGNADGAIDVVPAGGVTPYTYLWTPNGETTEDLSNLVTGIYGVTLTDAAGCEVAGSFTLINSNSPQLSTTQVNALCGLSNGSIDLTVTGGSDDFNYSWTGPVGFTASTEDITALSQGDYSVVVTDNQTGCLDSTSVSISASNGFEVSAVVTSATCNLDNASVTLILTGGAEPFSFTWCNGQTTQNATGLAPGACEVTVTDGNGCLYTESYVINNIPGLTLSGNTINATCGQCDGSVSLQLTDAAQPVAFLWSNGATSQSIADLCADDYSVTATDVNGCSDSYSTTVTGGSLPVITFTQINTLCGESNGSIDITVQNVTIPYSFNWTGPSGFSSISEDISGLAVGVYTVIVTDDQTGCSDSSTVTITNSNSFDVSASVVSATCNLDNGAVTLIINGGTEPFTYSWCNGQTTQNATGLAPGTCEVTVTDGSGCVFTDSYTIGNTPSLALSGNAINATCGLCNGSVALQLTDAANPVTFLWDNGASSQTITDLCAGDYSVTATDANGCSDSYSTTVTGGTNPEVTSTQVNTNCGESTGSIDISVLNGTQPYSYSWSGPAGFIANSEDITGLAAGAYTVIVTDGAGCSGTLTATILNLNDPVLSFSVTNASCGSATGAINLTVSVATGPFVYSWSGPSGFTASSEDLTAIGVGLYTVTVTSGSCSVTGDTSIINTDAPTASISLSNDTICAGEPLTLSIDVVGFGPFTFVYSDGVVNYTETLSLAGTFSVAVSPVSTTTYSMVSLISNAAPTCLGNFPIGSANIVVNPTPVQPVITASGPLSFCEGGSVILTSSAQTGNIWNNLGPDQLNQSITVTESGVYFVTVTNSFGCSATSDSVEVIVQPAASTFAGNDTTICAGTTLQFQGTGADSYLWSPSIYLSGTIISNPVCTPFETTTYFLTGTNGCGVSVDTVVITVLPIVNTSLGNDLTVCPGETINLSVEDVAGATYAWEPAGSFIGTSNTAAVSFIATTATSVSVTTTNTNGCIATDTIQINLNTPPAAPVITAQGPTTFCQGDSLILQSSTGNFVIWSNGLENFDEILVTTSGTYYVTSTDGICPATSDSIVVTVIPNPAATILTDGNTTVCQGTCVQLSAVQVTGLSWTLPDASTSTSATLSACISGYYVLNVTENGCVGSDSVLITIVPLPEQPVITLDGPSVICENEFVTLVSSYATGNQWLINGNPILGETNNTISISLGGPYSVSYTNGLGCTVVSPVQVITVKPVTPMNITASADTVLCGNDPETVQLTASSGFVLYEWSTTESTQVISINGAGTYTVTGTNQDGCVTQGSITFITAPAFNLNLVSPVYFDNYNVTIQGATDGSIDLTVDPSGIYAYSWSNGATTEDLANIPAGIYSVTVSDEFGCPQTASIEVKEPGDIKLPNGFTPNGDGFNDFYVIKGIQGYTNSQVDIFNRWGNLVYSKKGYTNDWNGLSNDGNQLPDATYFIVVDLNTEGKENVKGFIDIRRK